MLLRGIRAQWLTSAISFLLTLVVTGGAVAVVGAGRVGGTPGAVAAMLALYGAVALAEQTARATAARAHDVALARLRGMTGPHLIAFAAAPQLAVVLVGTAAGVGVGDLLAARISHAWSAPYSLAAPEVVVAVAILVGAWVTIGLVAGAAVRRPLVEALSVRSRHLGTSLTVRFLEILVVVAAVGAVYEAHRGGHSWVPVIAPALVALAAGQAMVWLLTLTPRIGRRLGIVLTSRRLRRDPDPAAVVRSLVAAGVLLTVTLTGGSAAAAWRDDAAHLRAGGPIVVPFKAGALLAYAAAYDADPKGQWLMPAAVVDDQRPTHRRVFVAADRWSTVVGDYYVGTSAARVDAAISDLTGQPGVQLIRGTSLLVQVSGLSADAIRHLPPGTAYDDEGVPHQMGMPQVAFHYINDHGYPGDVSRTFGANGTVRLPLRDCRIGCSAGTVTLDGIPTYSVDALRAGGVSLTDAPITHDASRHGPALTLADPLAQRAITTSGLPLGHTVDGVDGSTPAVDARGSVPAIPFLGHEGVLLDLGRVLLGANGSVPSLRAEVVARADTPASVLARLHRDGGGAPTTYDATLHALEQTSQARADELALLVAVGIALIALTHLVAWLVGQMPGRRAEAAGLRVAGFRLAAIRAAYLTEAVVLAGIVLVAVVVAALGTTGQLLRPIRLVGGWVYAPPLEPVLRPGVLVGVAGALLVVTVVACAVGFTRFGRRARPAALREDR